jgi:NRAMP (natural resistance-associated macrophage protein)-like metal ion transporter
LASKLSMSATPGKPPRPRLIRSLGLGLITGAADDDCSAIGTYAQAGAQLGYNALWTAPLTLPMMVTAVYLSGKLGQVTGQGLFSVLRQYLPRWLIHCVLTLVLVGHTIEAAADIGGMAAAMGILIHVRHAIIVIAVTICILILQIWGSYRLIRNVFRGLALSLVGYVISAFLSHPNLARVARGTFLPTVHFDRDTLTILVAIIGSSLSAYLFTWQSNEEVEEKEAAGKHSVHQRRGTTEAELASSRWDVFFGMLFSNIVVYFIMLATATTLFAAGHHRIETAADAAQSLEPLAGRAAGLLFTLGIVGVGFLAVPVMTIGSAYNVSQTFGWTNGLHRKPMAAKRFYAAITVFTLLAMALNFLGINPMRALVIAGIVQGFSTPPLMILIMIMTGSRAIMGERVNGLAANVLGWITTAVISAASLFLVFSWLHR